MGYYGRLEDKLLAQKLRKQGLSYNEILTKIHASKDTISRWCKDIELTQKQKIRLLNNKIFGQRKGSIIAADNKRLFRIAKTKKIFLRSKKQLGSLYKRDKFIAGIALYAGEGNKTDGQGGFANSDPRIIKFMINWFKTFCKIPNGKFRGAIWIHQTQDQIEAKRFWSDLTGIPQNHFHKTYTVKNKKNSNKIRKNIHPYGVFAIRFSKADIQRQIMGWIYALFGGKIASVL